MSVPLCRLCNIKSTFSRYVVDFRKRLQNNLQLLWNYKDNATSLSVPNLLLFMFQFQQIKEQQHFKLAFWKLYWDRNLHFFGRKSNSINV